MGFQKASANLSGQLLVVSVQKEEGNMSEGITAVHEFKQLIRYEKEGTYTKLFVVATIGFETVYEDYAECIISYQAGYMDYAIKIDWPFNDTVMHSLGLYGQYSTNFQKMEFGGKSLLIKMDNGEIVLSQGE